MTRVMEFSDENNLYLASTLILKKNRFSRILTSMDGNILATNQMSNTIIDINTLNRNACIFNYMPQLFWNYFKYENYEDSNVLEHNREDFLDLDIFILQIEQSYNDTEVFNHLINRIYQGISLVRLEEKLGSIDLKN